MSFVEQGDHNKTNLRQQYRNQLGGETLHWLREDEKYFLHQALSTPVMNVLARTEGAYIYDLSGKKYLDMHGNGVHNAGFSNPRVAAAVEKQLKECLAFTPRRYTNIPSIKLAKKLVEISPSGLDKVLFAPGGSEAIEMAVMIAKQITGNHKTISYRNAYHGTTFQAAALGGQEHFTMGLGPMIPGAFLADFPDYFQHGHIVPEQDAVDEICLSQIKKIIREEGSIAAIIGEPISAKPVVPSERYWREVRSICDREGIFLIFDEIIEGFGRTGKMFACEHYVTPDVLVLGKTLGGGVLPLAGILTWKKYDRLNHVSIGHYTHEKNPLCCAAGLAVIEYIEEQGLVENASALGEYLLAKLKELKTKHRAVGNISGRGLHIGLELVTESRNRNDAYDLAERLMYRCMEMGLAFKLIEGSIITLRPSLVINREECDFIADTIDAALSAEKC